MPQDAAGADPDHDIVEHLRGGRAAEAFDMLVARYDQKLFRLCFALLREYVAELPERYRRALVLYYYEERSVENVAALLGVPHGTVKTLLHRGRARLLERLGQAGMASADYWLEGAT